MNQLEPMPAPHRTPTAPPLIRTEGVGVSYRGRAALQGVDLPIPQGEITALIGPSGCGKTSFLNTLNRMTDLIPGCRVEGRIHLGDLSVLAPGTDVAELRRRVGMIFQRPNPFPLSIRQNLLLPLQEHGRLARAEQDARIEVILRDVGLWNEVKDRLHRPALALSGGQQQRLCFARALTLQPEVLLLDEPCSALDPIATGVVEELILRLRGQYTVVVVTHNLAQARRVADHVALFWLRDGTGRLIEHGETRQVFDAPCEPETADYVRGIRG